MVNLHAKRYVNINIFRCHICVTATGPEVNSSQRTHYNWFKILNSCSIIFSYRVTV
jgi:hypothetical protein